MRKHTPDSSMPSLFDGKTCSICRFWKPFSDYATNNAAPDDLSYFCRSCRSEIHRRRLEDPVIAIGTKERARQANQRRRENPATLAHMREQADAWHRHNKERRKQWRQKWAIGNERYRARTKANRQTRRARLKGNGGSFTGSEWVALCAKHDHRCLCCGERKPLTPDHVLPVVKGGDSNITNIQPLCQSCNSRKHDKYIDYRPR